MRACLEIEVRHDVLDLLLGEVRLLDAGVGLGHRQQQRRAQHAARRQLVDLLVGLLDAIDLRFRA